MRIKTITRNDEYILDEFVSYLKRKVIIPIVGSGFSVGACTEYSGKVPSGSEYRQHMLDEIFKGNTNFKKEKINSYNFSQICDLYEKDKYTSKMSRRKYLKENFSGVILNDYRKKLLSIDWPYIYTLNIDDAIENNSQYSTIVLPGREVREEVFLENKCVIKLHGDVKDYLNYSDSYRVFTSTEYCRSLFDNQKLYKKLLHDYNYFNLLYIGCSLDDELDLFAIATYCQNNKKSNSNTKIYYFTAEQIDELKENQLEKYGITDVIIFPSYKFIYEFIALAYDKASRINKDELNLFHTLSVKELDLSDKLNTETFFNGTNIFDEEKRCLVKPAYYIERDIVKSVISQMENYRINFLLGNRLSGKTFVLLGIYENIKDRIAYYFGSTIRLNQEALKKLLSLKNIAVLLDVDSIDRMQFEMILLNAKTIRKNKSNFILCVNNSNGDAIGLIKWKLSNDEIKKDDFETFDINSRLSSIEAKQINELLPYCNLPAFNIDDTILDNLVKAEKLMKKTGRFSSKTILVETKKEMACLIALATKQKLYSSEIAYFDFYEEIVEVEKKYSPFIEKVTTANFEKDDGFSPVKYVLNGRNWLCREIGRLALERSNFSTIIEAYEYIIKCINDITYGNSILFRKKVVNIYCLIQSTTFF